MVRWTQLILLIATIGQLAWGQQSSCELPISERQHCGPLYVSEAADCEQYEFCCYDPFARPHCFVKRASPLIFYIRVFILQDQLRESLKQQVDRAFSIIQEDNVDKLDYDPVSSHVKLNALLEAFVSQSTISNMPEYPECPLRVPLCMRTKCGPRGSSENPNLCYQDPRCCFDPDIAIYRGLFGPGFMANTPACYHGPTSGYYMKLANQLLPWNVFYQKTVVDLFDVTAQNHHYHAICSLTLALAETVLKSPICGWEGITGLECKLRDCCFNAKNGDCRYPNDRIFSGALDDLEIYPELKAESMDEAQCSPIMNIYADANENPSLYRRLPCNRYTNNRKSSGGGLLGISPDWCPRPTCCHDLNFEGSFIKILRARNLSAAQMPDFKEVDTSSRLATSAFDDGFDRDQQFQPNYCPFFFLRHDALPDLNGKLNGCCVQHSCYHIKRFDRVVRSRSTLTADQSLRDLVSYSFSSRNVNDDPNPGGGYPSQAEEVEEKKEEDDGSSGEMEGSGSSTSRWEQWSTWSQCSKTCGAGIKTKRRHCVDVANGTRVDKSRCGGDSFDAATCTVGACDAAQWTMWSMWSACQAGCGFGHQFRLRRCESARDGPGADVDPQRCGDEGRDKEARSCRGLSCAAWTQWSEYAGCNATCGQMGMETRRRTCVLDGKPTQVCFGAAINKRPCSAKNCSDEEGCSEAANCMSWTSWMCMEQCSTTCGAGSQTRWRCKMNRGETTKCAPDTVQYKKVTCNEDVECT